MGWLAQLYFQVEPNLTKVLSLVIHPATHAAGRQAGGRQALLCTLCSTAVVVMAELLPCVLQCPTQGGAA